jgi:hypothetical protein
MDQKNLFETPATYGLLRLENLAGLAICIGLLVMHRDAVRWPVFVLLFAYIDVIGYFPGAIVFRRARGQPLSPAYYVLYNTMHSALCALLVAGLWAWFVRPEWALLAMPIHLFGDRSLFGNFLKPFGVSFEPAAHVEFARFRANYLGSSRVAGEQDAP